MNIFYMLGSGGLLSPLILVILFIILFSRTSSLKKQITDLSIQLEKLKTGGDNVSTNYNQASIINVPQSANLVTENITRSTLVVEKTRDENNFVFDWLKENPLLKIGVLMILVGFGWFVSYAFAHDWIGPVGRIALGIAFGAIITIIGTIRLPKNQVQGNGLTILGTALVIITILAGQYYYLFFTPYVVLVVVFIVSLYVSLTSIAYNDEKLALYGMIVSLLAPALSHIRNTGNGSLYMYLAVISIGMIWITITKNWKTICPMGITGILLYCLNDSAGGALAMNPSKYFILLIVYFTSLLYLCVGVWGLIENKIKAELSDLYLAIVNTIIILVYTIYIVPPVYQSIVIAIWMLVFAFSGFLVFMKTRNEKLFYIHTLISILLLAIATSIELSGQTLVIAFAFEAAIIIISSFIVTDKIKIAEYFAMLLLAPVFMSLPSIYSSKWGIGIIHSDFFVLVVISVILALLGYFYRLNRHESNSELNLHQVMFITSSVYAFIIIWLSAHSLIVSQDTAVFFSLFVYTIVGLSCYFYGIFNQNVVLKKYGMAVLVAVVVRLVIVDVWKMELALRVVTFIVLGVMFMSSAFISKNKDLSNKLM